MPCIPYLPRKETGFGARLLLPPGRQSARPGVWSFLIVFFYFQHGLQDFIYNVFTHNLGYIQTESWTGRWRVCGIVLADLSHTQALVWALAAAGFVALGMTGRRKWLLFLAGWLITSLMAVSASGFFYPHYFQQTLPVLALAGVLGAEAVYGVHFWGTFLAGWGRKTLLGTALVILPAIAIYPFIFSYTPQEAVQRIYPGNQFAEMPEIGRRLAQVTGPKDRVYIFGAEPEVLFYARRVSATRYIFLIPLYGPYKDARIRQMLTAGEVADARPAAALYLPNNLFFMPGTEQFLTGWTRSYLQTNFNPSVYLTVDPEGNGRLISSGDTQALADPPGQQIAGMLGVRKAR